MFCCFYSGNLGESDFAAVVADAAFPVYFGTIDNSNSL